MSMEAGLLPQFQPWSSPLPGPPGTPTKVSSPPPALFLSPRWLFLKGFAVGATASGASQIYTFTGPRWRFCLVPLTAPHQEARVVSLTPGPLQPSKGFRAPHSLPTLSPRWQAWFSCLPHPQGPCPWTVVLGTAVIHAGSTEARGPHAVSPALQHLQTPTPAAHTPSRVQNFTVDIREVTSPPAVSMPGMPGTGGPGDRPAGPPRQVEKRQTKTCICRMLCARRFCWASDGHYC